MISKKLTQHKSIFLFALVVLATTSLILSQWEKIDYFFVFFPSNKPAVITARIIVNNNSIDANSRLFYGVNVDMSQILSGSDKYVVNSKGEDLIDIAHRLGINMFRITNSADAFSNKSDETFTKSQWNKVLNKMNLNGIKAIILVETPGMDQEDYSAKYTNLVKDYIIKPEILNHQAVYGVDVRNEPLINSSNFLALEKAAGSIKKYYPKTLITIGGWKIINPKGVRDGDPYLWSDPDSGKVLGQIVDFYSLHIYGYDEKTFNIHPNAYNLTIYELSRIKNVSGKKPILVGEFGSGNGDAITDQKTLGSKDLQANVYVRAYQAIQDSTKSINLLGSIAYVFYPRDLHTDGWNIVSNKGDYIYPAAYVLQKYATGQSDIPLDFLNTKNPQSYLLTNIDNGKTINLSKDDIVGLNLALDNKNDNYTSLNNKTVLYASEDLKYNSVNDKFNAVFHATKSGTATVRVIEKNKQGKKTEKFKVTVVVK